MAINLQDEILEFENYKEYNIAYPVIITRWEIKQVQGLNKQYLQVYFQKLSNDVKAFQINVDCYSAFGKELYELPNILIQDVEKKEKNFSQVIPLNTNTRRVEIFLCQCLCVDGSIIEENERQMVVNTFSPFEKEDEDIGEKILSCAKGYPIDNITHWYCACGVLNFRNSQKCIACDSEKDKIFQLITQKNIQEEKEKIKRKEIEQQRELEIRRKKTNKQLKMSAIIGMPFLAVLIITIILVCALVPIHSVKSDNMEFEKIGDTYTLVDYHGSDTELKIPSKIRGLEVTGIGDFVFEGRSFKSIEIPSSVTSIGNYAFYGCGSLASIEIPSSVTSIGNYAFYGCSSLTSIIIPGGVTSIGYEALYNCSNLTSIEIPSSVESIDSWAFYGCSALTIFCEAESKPSGWDSNWNKLDYNGNKVPVVWGHRAS